MSEQTPPDTEPTPSPDVVEVPDAAAFGSLVHDAANTQHALWQRWLDHDQVGFAKPAKDRDLTDWRFTGDTMQLHERDLTATFAAGSRFDQIDKALGEVGQWLPIDVPGDMTIGEAVDHRVQGPMRAGFGGWCDLLLGAQFVDGLGKQITVGGRTVKNVAGLDITRLLVGAMGQFGGLTAVTVRTFAQPASIMQVRLDTAQPQVIDAMMPTLLTCDAQPGGVSIACSGQSCELIITWFGSASGMTHRLRSLETLIDQQADLHMASARTIQIDHLRQATDAQAMRQRAGQWMKLIVAPRQTGFWCQALRAGGTRAEPWHIVADPMHGIVHVFGFRQPESSDRLAEQLIHLQSQSPVTWQWIRRHPSRSGEPWSGVPLDQGVLGRIKSACDPHHVLNPGRLGLIVAGQPGRSMGGGA